MAAVEFAKKIQIYPSLSSSARQDTPFWKDKYERDAKKYWVKFYRKHKVKLFKDWHYFDKERGHYFMTKEGETLVVLEVGCGARNSVFPLVSTYPNMFIYACDFSPRAINLVKSFFFATANHPIGPALATCKDWRPYFKILAMMTNYISRC